MMGQSDSLPPQASYRYDEIPRASKAYRIVFFAKTKRHTAVTKHFIRGFEENGHQVLWIHPSRSRSLLGKSLANAYMTARLKLFRPDLVLIYQKDIPPEVLRSISSQTAKAVFYGDFRDEPDREVVECARHCDFFFTDSRGQIPAFQNAGVTNAFYLRRGCDPTDHYRVEPDPSFASEVAFIGKPHSASRVELIQAIQKRFHLHLYGSGWESALGCSSKATDVYPEQYRKICASTKIILGIDCRDDVDLCFSNRTWLTLGCGGFLLTRYVPNLEEFFTSHRHLVWYKSADECLDLIAHYLSKDEERRRVARTGYDYARTYHTFRHTTAEMIARIFGEKW